MYLSLDDNELEEGAHRPGPQCNAMDEKLALTNTEVPFLRRKWMPFTTRYTIRPLLLIVCCALLVLFDSGSILPTSKKEVEVCSTWKFGIARAKAGLVVKEDEAVSTTSTTSTAAATSTGVLEVFQVYPPVLTPDGVTDETILSDRSGNTTVFDSTAAATTCQVLLMDFSFGNTYGNPFVGTFFY